MDEQQYAKQVTTQEPRGLRTLADYRRAAKDPQCYYSLFREGENTPLYNVIKTALDCTRQLINFARTVDLQTDPWDPIWFGDSEYAMKNMQLFDAVKLMEFAITYKEVHSIYGLFPDWPKRGDPNTRVFTSAGLSFLEAAFLFVHEWGRDIIGNLQNAYREYRKKGNVIYGPFDFLSNTPEVDHLEINPVPNIIIRTWFDVIVQEVQNWIQRYELSVFKIEAEFNSIKTQLEYEWNSRTPKPNLMAMPEILDHVNISERTLRRRVDDKKLIDYRPKDHTPNAPMILDLEAVEKLYPDKVLPQKSPPKAP